MTDYAGTSPVNNKFQKESKSKHRWLLIAILFLLLMYLGGAFLAPVMMKTGHSRFGLTIYKAYRLACHQLTYRSIFLFGEQAFYPLELAGVKGLKTYQELIGSEKVDVEFAKSFVGNEQTGYKVALCQRDIAIFLSMFIFVLIYAFFGKRIKPVPWWVWLFLAVMPIGLDGLSQLISQMRLTWLSCLPVRESTPILRILTGSLFGFISAWFIISNIFDYSETAQNTKPILPSTGKQQNAEEIDKHENN